MPGQFQLSPCLLPAFPAGSVWQQAVPAHWRYPHLPNHPVSGKIDRDEQHYRRFCAPKNARPRKNCARPWPAHLTLVHLLQPFWFPLSFLRAGPFFALFTTAFSGANPLQITVPWQDMRFLLLSAFPPLLPNITPLAYPRPDVRPLPKNTDWPDAGHGYDIETRPIA